MLVATPKGLEALEAVSDYVRVLQAVLDYVQVLQAY